MIIQKADELRKESALKLLDVISESESENESDDGDRQTS